MEIELISIGDRLLLSDILDTNAAYLSRQLHDAALPVVCKTTVGDNLAILLDVLQSATQRSEIVITIGGQADQPNGLIQRAIAHLQDQVEIDERPLHLRMGDCPLLIWPRLIVAALPDNRREMAYLLTTALLPYMQQRFSSQWHNLSMTLQVVGIAQSSIEDRLSDLMPYELSCISYNSYAGQTAVSLWADSRSEEQATIKLDRLRQLVELRLGDHIFGEGEDRLEQHIAERLRACDCHLAIAECGTGGNFNNVLNPSTLTDVTLHIDNIAAADREELNAQLNYVEDEFDTDVIRWGRTIAEKLLTQFGSDLGLFIYKRVTSGGVQIIVTLATLKGISIAQRFFGGQPQSINDWASTLGLDHLYRWLQANTDDVCE